MTEDRKWGHKRTEHFEKLLNKPAPLNLPDIEVTHTDHSIDDIPPTTEETSIAVRQTKSGEVAGPNGISTDAPNSETELATKMLNILLRKI